MISYWLPEIKDTPARVTIMAIPNRQELRVKNLFNVATVIYDVYLLSFLRLHLVVNAQNS